jgi:hypothetical protein
MSVSSFPAYSIGEKVKVKKAGKCTVGVIDAIHSESGTFDITAEYCPMKNKTADEVQMNLFLSAVCTSS